MKITWTEQDHEEHEALLVEASRYPAVRQQVAVLLDGVRDGVQAHRQWAVEIEDEALRSGLGSHIKRWRKATNRVKHKRGNRIVDRPGVVGIRRASADGAAVAVQLELDQLSRDELDVKRTEYLTQLKAYGDNLAVVDALRALLDASPGARTPREAASRIGTTVEAWLLGEQAA